ncbi:hypothetical protein [Anaeromyxobacter diazotrophicus]|uniref:Membrane-bound metal-dependent hydrolase n=1 Tax=Anaeromyxobacter diazotrophicus TaxID=2590199 RepID=A0A7I9VII0_9BACT|nr:hypothetical protein [Anaeromyxobacter diazotrophicus]GEJ55938.1 hypothetical protein AMYX_06790 [Anaeromyxobacter diazotrophicus]
MFLGHFAVALAAKRAAPRASLGTLFLAAQWLDLVWPALVLAGVEEVRVAPGDTAFTPLAFVHYPWTHSLALVVAWAAALGGAYLWRTGRRREAAVVAALVVSHWVLDLASHRPDLPLAPGAAKVGLGLWNSVPATLAVESALFLAGVLAYASFTRARSRAGRYAFWGLVAALAGIYAASALGPPPPSPRAIAAAGLLLWLFVPWAAYVDRRRAPVAGTSARTEAPLLG